MCLYPRLIKNRKYIPNKKNGGKPPPLWDERIKMVPVGCQKCIECRKQKSREWMARLNEDIKYNKNAKFVTLTFSNESIKSLEKEIKNAEGYQLDNEIATLAVRRFLERWRKKTSKSIRHMLITELGQNGTENIHLHGLIWTDNVKEIKEKWTYGYSWVGDYVNARTINYIVKYITKIDDKHKGYKSKILASPGIGKEYTNRSDAKKNEYKGDKTNETYRTPQGHKIGMPIYWRNKIYTDEEREKLWIQKIDKEERYVLGTKIKINNGYEEYNKALKQAQKINKRLGYGNDEKNWQEEEYERQRRRIMIDKRIKAAKIKYNGSAGVIQKDIG